MSPPGGNAFPPINVSGITQTKTGTLQVPMIADPITPTYYIAPGGPVSATLYGRVGIGTDNPGAMLDINGQIKISGGTPGAGKVLTSDATGLASWQPAASGLPDAGTLGQTLHSDGTNWVADSSLFNNGTNVGIGTTNPQGKLQVGLDVTNRIIVDTTAAIGNSTPLLMVDSDSGAGAAVGLNKWFMTKGGESGGVGGAYDGGSVWIQYGPQDAPLEVLQDYDNPPRIQFQQVGSGTESAPQYSSWIGMAKQNSSDLSIMGGNVGIGTTSPIDKLHIESDLSGTGNANDSSIMVRNLNPIDVKTRLRFITDAGEFLIARTSTTYSPWQASAGDAVFNLQGNPNNFRFLTKNAASVSADRMIITSEGDMSIPTQGKGLILKATDGSNCYRVTVNNAGALSTALVTCP